MTERELKKLNRADLLELLLEQSRENEQILAQLKRAEAQLEDRRIQVEKAGSLAEASLQLNGVFQAAEAACAQYTENIRHLSEEQEQRCAQMERETQAKCDRMIAEAEQKSQAYWDEVSKRIHDLCDSYAGLQQLLGQNQQLFAGRQTP